ncbi:MAG TPA: asparagine synthase (glutamine-hydrolyzing) [Candidatus Acidoferrales bacterium]|jgi:asparagine synthase (glutamine-hydrolysing)|nr:asparagine synthase (glutamine-hydrolyzing) [Candidatus Acidoferrales bacterium]
MCGIAGFTHKGWSPGRERIGAAIETLRHRGPDQQGVFHSSICSIGATRLKIIDLVGGDQPIKSDDGDTVIVFNGEIYNHQELRGELEARGHRFHSRTDTETVLHAFLEWDVECFARMRGMFATGLWSESKKRLVLARDRMGIKPLYIARLGEDLLFGSELKAILVHPELDRRLSLNGLDCYLSLNYVPYPWTLVEGIEKLAPGCWLEWIDGKVSSEAYWKLPFVAPRLLTWNAAKEELDYLLKESIREHMLSDVPLGVWLSGGIDSSTVLHYASQASSSQLKTLSITFRGRSFDESGYIREVAEQYGTDHEQFDLNPSENLADAIEQFAYYSDEPTADAGALPIWFLSKLSKTKVTVTLSGEGGDEIFGGYLTYRANQLAHKARYLPQGSLKLALRALGAWPVSDDKISLEYKLKRFIGGCLRDPEQAHVYWNGTFSAEQKGGLVDGPFPTALDHILGDLREKLPGDGISPFLWFDQKYYLPGDILAKVDRMSMAHAVEARPPLLDHRLVEFAASLPAAMKVNGSRQKVLLRELMHDKLPASVLNRRKAGLDIPSHEWLRGPLRPLLLDALETGVAEHGGIFRKSAIDRCVREHLERRANVGYHLWGLMILFLWMRKWRIQSAPISAPETPVTEAARAFTI